MRLKAYLQKGVFGDVAALASAFENGKAFAKDKFESFDRREPSQECRLLVVNCRPIS